MAEDKRTSYEMRHALADMLYAIHYTSMSMDVMKEPTLERLKMYAKVIVRDAPEKQKEGYRRRLVALGLL